MWIFLEKFIKIRIVRIPLYSVLHIVRIPLNSVESTQYEAHYREESDTMQIFLQSSKNHTIARNTLYKSALCEDLLYFPISG